MATDTERIDFLQRQRFTKYVGYDVQDGQCVWPVFRDGDLRGAIDYAMERAGENTGVGMPAVIYLSYNIEINCILSDTELDKIENAKTSPGNRYIEIDTGDGKVLAVLSSDIVALRY